MFIFEREKDRVWVGKGRDREGDTKSEAGSRLWALSTEPNAGHEPTNCKIMTWAEVGCSIDWATQGPQRFLVLMLDLSSLLLYPLENTVSKCQTNEEFPFLSPLAQWVIPGKILSKNIAFQDWKCFVFSLSGLHVLSSQMALHQPSQLQPQVKTL